MSIHDISKSAGASRLPTSCASACTKCLATGCEMSRCSKCKTAMYCSKKCQVEHWSYHKKWCSKVDGSGLLDFIENVVCNTLFNAVLQACFTLHFDLLRAPQLDKPFVVLVDLAVEPVEFRDFCRIYTGQALGDEKIMGMVQINSFLPYSSAQAAALLPTKHALWRRYRDGVNALDPESAQCSVGVAEIANGENRQTMTYPIFIMEAVLDLVPESPPWKLQSPVTGAVTEMPLTIEGSMEYLNSYIRNDTKNEMLLRMEMRPSDIKVIRDAGAGSDSFNAIILRDKMEREAVFRPLVDWIKHRAAE
ncbi:hypothetical protein C8R44DRAFT_986854 [Mycena epipterygia]|nr:hypothetical protein C8R44DRAFT_986854 [Mycena epipterygia]